jgi:hypothetical protein
MTSPILIAVAFALPYFWQRLLITPVIVFAAEIVGGDYFIWLFG